MKKLFAAADEYLQECSWKDLTLLKLCLAAAGLLLGLAVPKKCRPAAAFLAVGVFIGTYLPLMGKFLPILNKHLTGRGEENV